MNSIEADQRGKSDLCMLDLVSKWVAHQNGTSDLPRTWQTVVEAVRDSGFGQLASELAEKYRVTLSQQWLCYLSDCMPVLIVINMILTKQVTAVWLCWHYPVLACLMQWSCRGEMYCRPIELNAHVICLLSCAVHVPTECIHTIQLVQCTDLVYNIIASVFYTCCVYSMCQTFCFGYQNLKVSMIEWCCIHQWSTLHLTAKPMAIIPPVLA